MPILKKKELSEEGETPLRRVESVASAVEQPQLGEQISPLSYYAICFVCSTVRCRVLHAYLVEHKVFDGLLGHPRVLVL
jgi:hypothetical protein